jgi:hypothetical protein
VPSKWLPWQSRQAGTCAHRITLHGQLPALGQTGRIEPGCFRWRIRYLLGGKILGHLAQVRGVLQLQEVDHQWKVPASGLEIEHLIEQIPSRFACDAWIVAVRGSEAACAVAGGAGLNARRDGIGLGRSRQCRDRGVHGWTQHAE